MYVYNGLQYRPIVQYAIASFTTYVINLLHYTINS